MAEWITTAEAAKILKVSRRNVTERARQRRLKAKREGKNWLIHSSLSAGDEEHEDVRQRIPDEAYRKLEEQVEFLKEQMQRKDEQIRELQKALDQNQQLLAYAQLPWWRKLGRKALSAPGDVMDMEPDIEGKTAPEEN